MCDVLIVNGRVIDGTGNAWFYGDVAITGNAIERVAPAGTIDRGDGDNRDRRHRTCGCPGFIDIQSHSIISWLTDNRSLSKVTQGITTEILGESWTPAPYGGENLNPFDARLLNRGHEAAFAEEWEARAKTWTRFGDWLADIQDRAVSVNFGSFIGGSTVRRYGMADRMGDANAEELARMREVTAAAMEDGAFGIATALIYPPNAFSTTDELVAVMEVVAPVSWGAYHPHPVGRHQNLRGSGRGAGHRRTLGRGDRDLPPQGGGTQQLAQDGGGHRPDYSCSRTRD